MYFTQCNEKTNPNITDWEKQLCIWTISKEEQKHILKEVHYLWNWFVKTQKENNNDAIINQLSLNSC